MAVTHSSNPSTTWLISCSTLFIAFIGVKVYFKKKISKGKSFQIKFLSLIYKKSCWLLYYGVAFHLILIYTDVILRAEVPSIFLEKLGRGRDRSLPNFSRKVDGTSYCRVQWCKQQQHAVTRMSPLWKNADNYTTKVGVAGTQTVETT